MSPSVWRPLSKPRQPVSRETLYCWENPKCHSSICARSPASLPPSLPMSSHHLIPLLSSPLRSSSYTTHLFFLNARSHFSQSLSSISFLMALFLLTQSLSLLSQGPRTALLSLIHFSTSTNSSSFKTRSSSSPLPFKASLIRLDWHKCSSIPNWNIYFIFLGCFFLSICHCCLGTMGWKCKKEKSPRDSI